MLTLPPNYLTLITAFAPVFSRRLWQHVQVLLVGAILALAVAGRNASYPAALLKPYRRE